MRLAFDIETDPIRPGSPLGVTRIHCLTAVDLDSGDEHSFGPDRLAEAATLLNSATMLAGHNIIAFDLPVCRALLPDCSPSAGIVDTLLLSQVLFSGEPSHSLASWALALDDRKLSFQDFTRYSDKMLEYCLQDARLTARLFHHLTSQQPYPDTALRMEHEFATYCREATLHGIQFDSQAAIPLRDRITVELQEVTYDLNEMIPPKVEVMRTPAYWSLKRGDQELQFATKGEASQARKVRNWTPSEALIEPGPMRKKETPFNPGSGHQLSEILRERYQWEPELTECGNAKTDGRTLELLPYPEVKKVLQWRELTKQLGYLSDGANAWLKMVSPDGIIHHTIRTCGTISGRCSHSDPNLGQVPGGSDFRRLFRAREGRYLVGADLDRIEAVVLAHYLAKWDGGAFADVVLAGDFHTHNQEAAGLETRDQAKTFCFAALYGAGIERLSSIVNLPEEEVRAAKDRFFSNLAGLRTLKTAQHAKYIARGYVEALDGRRIRPRAAHAVLNALIQSAAAIVMKRWTCLTIRRLKTRLATFSEGEAVAQMVLNVHDELQFECSANMVSYTCRVLEDCAALAGESLNLNVPISASAVVGNRWSETH